MIARAIKDFATEKIGASGSVFRKALYIFLVCLFVLAAIAVETLFYVAILWLIFKCFNLEYSVSYGIGLYLIVVLIKWSFSSFKSK